MDKITIGLNNICYVLESCQRFDDVETVANAMGAIKKQTAEVATLRADLDTERDQHQNTALHLIDAHAEIAMLREQLEDVTAQRDSLRSHRAMKRTSAAPTGEPGANA
jgi:chromosome segregation ATPase